MARNTGTTQATGADQADVDALFPADGTPSGGEDDFADIDDLLGSIKEDDAEGWNPKEKGEAVAGRLIKISTTKSDFARDGEDPNVPTWTIQTKSGDKYRVIGFASVLKRNMIDSGAEVGDLVGVKYFGEKPLKQGKFAGKPYRDFQVAVMPSNR